VYQQVQIPRLLDKPEFWYRPRQILSRCLYAMRTPPRGSKVSVTLPWGLQIHCNPVGRAISTQGLYDLVVSKTICRLLDSGELAIDVGANIGYMSGLMAWRSGPRGRVLAFEPSSAIRPTLMANLQQWKQDPALAPIDLHLSAVSDVTGTAVLRYPGAFAQNEGVASLELDHSVGRTETVTCVTLDSVLDPSQKVGVMKIDVEGHELAVLKGARELLAAKRVRDIIFEEHRPWPSPVHKLLRESGYAVFRLSRTLTRLLLVVPDGGSGSDQDPIGVLPNYLATADAKRARQLLEQRGWRVLGA